MNPLDQLRDIHTPKAVSIWPLAPGWWLLIFLGIAIIAWLLYRWLSTRQQRLCKQHALQELESIFSNQNLTPQQCCIASNRLLKRYCLSAGYTNSASLFGKDWLDFLDGNGGHQGFSSELSAFADIVYQSANTKLELDLNKLKLACSNFIRELQHV